MQVEATQLEMTIILLQIKVVKGQWMVVQPTFS
jgi:hypothetical protein